MRSLFLCAAGAILGLIIAGYGLFTAHGTRTAGVPAEDVALVNQVPVLRSDFIAQLRALHDVSPTEATPAEKRDVLDAMVREELYVQRGIELGIPSDDIDVRAALVASTEAATAADVLASRPAEDELIAYYRAHAKRYRTEGTMLLADFVAEPGISPATAASLAAQLRRGDMPAVLTRTSQFADGEEYWFAARLHLGDRLFAAASALPDGGVSRPVVAGGRVHLLRMIHNHLPVLLPLAQVRDKVLADFQKDKTERLEAANARFLRRRADIQIADDL